MPTQSESEILSKMDSIFEYSLSNKSFSNSKPNEINYYLIPSFSDFYLLLAGTRIHLYANNTKWTIVFELNGYNLGDYTVSTFLYYIGDYIDIVDNAKERKYISNMNKIVRLNYEDISKICNDDEYETILKPNNVNSITLHGRTIHIESDIEKYENAGIELTVNDRNEKIITIKDIVRYIWHTDKEALLLNDNEIRKNIDTDLHKIMTIDHFHYNDLFSYEEVPPSKVELFQMIAKVIASQDSTMWKPTENPNNHWKNWLDR